MRVTILIDKFPRTPMREVPADMEPGDEPSPRDSITGWDPRAHILPWMDEEQDESIEPYPITH
jgi:hypothetical protein